MTEPDLFRRVDVLPEVHAIPKDVLVRLEVTQEAANGIENRLDGMAGDISAAKINPQRTQQRQVDEVAPARDVVELPERIVASIVGADVDEAARADREVVTRFAAHQHA